MPTRKPQVNEGNIMGAILIGCSFTLTFIAIELPMVAVLFGGLYATFFGYCFLVRETKKGK